MLSLNAFGIISELAVPNSDTDGEWVYKGASGSLLHPMVLNRLTVVCTHSLLIRRLIVDFDSILSQSKNFLDVVTLE